LTGKVSAVSTEGEERLFTEEEWRAADPIPKIIGRKGQGKKGGGSSRPSTIDIWGIQDLPEDD
jgi:hypothetical protein